MTPRSVSLAAGKAPGYVHSLLVEGKDPSVDNLTKVCEVVGVTLPYVLYGYQMSPATERLLLLIESRPDLRDGVLKILESQAGLQK